MGAVISANGAPRPTQASISAALRAVKLKLVGSGQGSVDTRDFLAELGVLAQEITSGTLTVATRTVPLAEVETAWVDTWGSERIVIVP